MLTWMAWTWPTAVFFIFITISIVGMFFLEKRNPGGARRRGVLRLHTTRGDRLFISLLGSCYIFLLWIGSFGMPLWIPLFLSIIWFIFTFRKI